MPRCSDSGQQLLDAVESNEEEIVQRSTPVFQPFDSLLHGTDRTRLVCTIPFLKKFILYCKKMCHPVLSEEARQKIIDAFEDLRKKQDNSRTLPVTARQLETMIRLTTAHAKVRLSKDATDVRRFSVHRVFSSCYR
jgi:DNA replication licensing factor MCM3